MLMVMVYLIMTEQKILQLRIATGAYSLELNNLTSPVTIDTNKPGIDITTGASPGKIIVNPVNQTGIVSTPLSFLGDEYGSTSFDSVLTNMPCRY